MPTVRKRLQKLGNSRVLVIDRDLLDALVPDGDLEQTLLVSIVGDALVVRRETSRPLSVTDVTAASERMASIPERVLALPATDQALLRELAREAGNATELARRLGHRTRETVSTRLHALKRDGWVTRTGRDWRLTIAGRERLENDPSASLEGLAPAVARLVLALEAGPATAAELEERLGVKRSAVQSAIKQATQAGLVERDDLRPNAPVYRLARARPRPSP